MLSSSESDDDVNYISNVENYSEYDMEFNDNVDINIINNIQSYVTVQFLIILVYQNLI